MTTGAQGAQRFVVGPDTRERVDKLLAALMPGVSRSTVQRWIAEERVRVDGAVCKPKTEVRSGQVVDVEPGPRPPSDVEPDATVPFAVLHEDEHLIVVDKPAGIVVHPGRGHWNHTLVAGLLARDGFERVPFDARDPMGPLRPGIVHRLDKGTSGTLVVAKSEAAREGLKAQLSAHSMERVYRAITLGVPRAARIETLYGRHRTSRIRFTSRTTEGRRAATNVTVDEVLASGRAALVSCRLETGRTHQIRVHLSEQASTPILSDKLYGKTPTDSLIASVAADLGRQALHAQILGFVHPVTGEPLRFEAPLPPDFDRALTRLRKA